MLRETDFRLVINKKFFTFQRPLHPQAHFALLGIFQFRLFVIKVIGAFMIIFLCLPCHVGVIRENRHILVSRFHQADSHDTA